MSPWELNDQKEWAWQSYLFWFVLAEINNCQVSYVSEIEPYFSSSPAWSWSEMLIATSWNSLRNLHEPSRFVSLRMWIFHQSLQSFRSFPSYLLLSPLSPTRSSDSETWTKTISFNLTRWHRVTKNNRVRMRCTGSQISSHLTKSDVNSHVMLASESKPDSTEINMTDSCSPEGWIDSRNLIEAKQKLASASKEKWR